MGRTASYSFCRARVAPPVLFQIRTSSGVLVTLLRYFRMCWVRLGSSVGPSARSYVCSLGKFCFMKDATEPLFTKATYCKRREDPGGAEWHFTTLHPSVLLKKGQAADDASSVNECEQNKYADKISDFQNQKRREEKRRGCQPKGMHHEPTHGSAGMLTN